MHKIIKDFSVEEGVFHVFDTETANMKPFVDANGDTFGGICEISIRAIDPFTLETQKHYYSRLNPEGPIDAGAAGVHGIRDRDVVDCPSMTGWLNHTDQAGLWNDGPEDLVTVLIAHNIKFDYTFVKPYLNGTFMLVDTLKLARVIYPDAPNHKMQTLRVYLDLPFDVTDAHSAGGDTESLRLLLGHMMATTGLSLAELCLMAQKTQPVTKYTFGKYKGRLISEVDKEDPGYIDWLLKPKAPKPGQAKFELDPDVEQAIRDVKAARVKK